MSQPPPMFMDPMDPHEMTRVTHYGTYFRVGDTMVHEQAIREQGEKVRQLKIDAIAKVIDPHAFHVQDAELGLRRQGERVEVARERAYNNKAPRRHDARTKAREIMRITCSFSNGQSNSEESPST